MTPAAADRGDVRSEELGDLDGVRPDPTGRAIDQHPLSCLHVSHIAEALQCRDGCDVERCGPIEVDAFGQWERELRFGRHVFGAGSIGGSEDAVSWLQSLDSWPDCLDDAGEIDTEPGPLGSPKAVHEPEEVGRAGEQMPVERVQGRRVHLHQNAPLGRFGSGDVGEFEDFRPAVATSRNGSHGLGVCLLRAGGVN